MPSEKTYRLVIEITHTSAKNAKNELVYLMGKARLTPADAGPYYWDRRIKEYSRVVAKRDPDSVAALKITLDRTAKDLRDTARALEKLTEGLDNIPKLTVVPNA